MRALLLMFAALSAGCSTIDRMFENRALCSLDRQQMAMISWWSGWGVAAKISDDDAKWACRDRAGQN